MNEIAQIIERAHEIAIVRAGFIFAVSVMAAIVSWFVFSKILKSIVKKTETEFDDKIIEIIRRPVRYSFVLVGLSIIVKDMDIQGQALFVLMGIIKTSAVILWGSAASRVGTIILDILSKNVDNYSWVQPKTLPLFQITLKMLIAGGSIYFAFVAWNIDVTTWIASAGIVGIAVGFAAKDTLANLFSGVFILADAPYKIGDFIILDKDIRGIVTDIGMRSTRVLTRDDIEVTVPNAVIANSKIINETGGRHPMMRVRIKVDVAYGSDIDKVSEVILSCVEGIYEISEVPAPRVRFMRFGDSGLALELQVWITMPIFRGRVIDKLNRKVYKALQESKIEIPFPKQDLYIKEIPDKK